MTSDVNLLGLVSTIGKILTESDQTVTTVESCTGGGIAQMLTAIPGSSNWFDRGFVTYSNAAKTQMVGVPVKLLDQYGAVSNEVAESMATGGVNHAGASYAISVTGIAGPGGGTAEKPVGTVFLAIAGKGEKTRVLKQFHARGRLGFKQTVSQAALNSVRRVLAK